MSSWPAAKARRVLAALQRIGWRHDRTVGSHKILKKDEWPDYPFSFHDSEELGPAILAKISKRPAFGPKTCEAHASLAPVPDLGTLRFGTKSSAGIPNDGLFYTYVPHPPLDIKHQRFRQVIRNV